MQGQLADRWQHASRCGLLLVCQGVGYELQITRRHWDQLPETGQLLTLHVHQAIREDSWTLYGFSQRHERDLFRELVGVSGVGPQMALGLLGCLASEELVRAIVQADLRLLCQAPGVGKRTAERLSVELRSRLQERYGTGVTVDDDLALPTADQPSASAAPELREELQLTLMALGYDTLEINRALRAVAAQGTITADDAGDGEAWLRESLRWLGRQAA